MNGIIVLIRLKKEGSPKIKIGVKIRIIRIANKEPYNVKMNAS